MEKTKDCCGGASETSDVKSYIMIGMLAVILLILVMQSFQINSIKVSAYVTGAGVIDMSGWSENEKMQYEHHSTLPARLQNNAKQAPSMVGGC